jgi:hypothetical protein
VNIKAPQVPLRVWDVHGALFKSEKRFVNTSYRLLALTLRDVSWVGRLDQRPTGVFLRPEQIIQLFSPNQSVY